MLVAMPTAMPDEPLASRFGKLDGRTMAFLFTVIRFAKIDRVLSIP